MDPKVNYIAVGAFVLALLIATIIFSLWLAFGYGEKAQKEYLIYMSESVAGLSQDTVVKFNGVNVGAVKEIKLDRHDPSIVIIKIAVDASTPINTDTRATLMSQGLTGLSYVNLSGGDMHSPPLKVLPGHTLPIIPTTPSFLLKVDSTVNQLTKSIDQVSNAINRLLNPENQAHVSKILENLDHVTTTISEQRQQLNQTLKNLPILMQNLSQTSQQVGETFNTINYQTLPMLNETLYMMQGVLPNVANLSQELSENPSMLIRGRPQSVPGPGEH